MTKEWDAVLKALMSDIDIEGATGVLKEMGLPLEYSAAAVDAINAATNKLADQAAELKQKEAPRAKRLAVRQQVDRLVNARAFLYRLRSPQAGDVVAEVGTAGQ